MKWMMMFGAPAAAWSREHGARRQKMRGKRRMGIGWKGNESA
jgi:hypothetical protein